jgi:hypothetical protein
MQTSIFLARLIGPVMALVGVSLLVNELAFRKMAQEFLRSPALIFFSGMILMPAGLAVVLSHNVWVLNWPLIITLLGWIACDQWRPARVRAGPRHQDRQEGDHAQGIHHRRGGVLARDRRRALLLRIPSRSVMS